MYWCRHIHLIWNSLFWIPRYRTYQISNTLKFKKQHVCCANPNRSLKCIFYVTNYLLNNIVSWKFVYFTSCRWSVAKLQKLIEKAQFLFYKRKRNDTNKAIKNRNLINGDIAMYILLYTKVSTFEITLLTTNGKFPIKMLLAKTII